MPINVIKADGSTEEFVVSKLQKSLRRAGANRDEIASIVSEIEAIMHDGIRTQEIYRKAFELLRSSKAPVSARYSMRRALFGLGPTGFPFEDFLARIFEAEGYKTKTRVTLKGRCAEHELDVAAYNEKHSFVAEAKFHSRPGMKSDLQVALYSYARLIDLEAVSICSDDVCKISELMIVTNTKFTSSAEKYANCTGLTLLSWNYPKNNNLHDRIQRAGIYPITVLQSLSQTQKQALIKIGVITCKDILKEPQILKRLHLSSTRAEEVVKEATELCTQKSKTV
ncbi:restriction endonuclease [Candidatus Kaiserbacteria bacterium]|nr:restriction endonuclease [Candidatus Kaiserbacteria bacterium]